MSEKYPSLGFDPARGNVATVRDLATQMSDTATYAGEAHEVIKSVQDKEDAWKGPASQAFAGKLGDLPEYLDNAHSSLKKAGRALDTWADQLEQHQKKASHLEKAASEAIKEAKQADAAATEANAAANTPVMHDGSPGSAQTAQNQLNEKAEAASTANRAAGAAWDKVDNIRRQAQQLMETWHQNGAACAEQLNRAAELAPDKGFFESIGDALIGAGDWVMDHLEQIGDVAGMISAVAGALAFIPVLTPVMAPIAIVSGGAALAAHAGDIVANGKAGSLNAWISVGGDALGLIPGVGAISRGVDAATTSLRTVDGLMPAAASGFSDFAAEAARTGGDAASAFKWLGQNAADTFGGSADVLAKSMQGGVNIALQGPTAADWVVGNDTTGDVKNAAGAASAGLNSVQGVGSYGEAVHGGFDIGRSLRGFAAAVG